MLIALAAVIVLGTGVQPQASDRAKAEDLARAGRTAEAMALFERVAERDPDDVEARLWLGRLSLRLGNTAEAEARFRGVLREHPKDVDARIGLGTVLTRTGDVQGALAVLTDAEHDAGENSDLFGALARAYRRAGDNRRALEYFRRARALAPDDPDLVMGFEAVARVYGHLIAFEGFGQGGATSAGSGSVAGRARVTPALFLEGLARVQNGSGYSDFQGGGGALWLVRPDTTVEGQVIGGAGNVALATADAGGDVIRYTGPFEIGGGARWLTFPGARVGTASPVFAWYPSDAWRLDARYTFSRTSFEATQKSSNDSSVLVSETWQRWRRVALLGSYAYGIESFEVLTADRLGALGSNTVAAGVRIDGPSLTRITTTYEHQWRSNDTSIDRLTVSLVQVIP